MSIKWALLRVEAIRRDPVRGALRASQWMKIVNEANVLYHCRHSPAFARTMKDSGMHDLGSGQSVLTSRFTTSAHPKLASLKFKFG